MINSLDNNPSDPNLPDAPAKSGGFKRFGKKLYAIAAALAIVIIVVALMIPQSAAAIPLDVNYVVGEKMVYGTTASATIELESPMLSANLKMPNTTSVNYTQTIEVTSFDGEYYTLNHTTVMDLNLPLIDKPFSFSIIEKMNKTGYSTYMLGLGDTSQEISSTSLTGNSFLVQLLNKPEVKVGDTITVPYPAIENSYVQVTGDLTVTFGQIEDLTTPAGTYRVFKIDMTSNNIQMTLNMSVAANSSPYIPSDITMNCSMNYQVYLEYGTLRQVKSSMQQTAHLQSSIMNYTAQYSTEMTLNQHIKP